MADIILTWPKKRSLESYLSELEKAVEENKVICFRLPSKPARCETGDRCYMVHDGHLRGWLKILGFTDDPDFSPDGVEGEEWASGNYLIRDPEWHPCAPTLMSGFQGFRYMENER